MHRYHAVRSREGLPGSVRPVAWSAIATVRGGARGGLLGGATDCFASAPRM
jgi:hypothetical protein